MLLLTLWIRFWTAMPYWVQLGLFSWLVGFMVSTGRAVAHGNVDWQVLFRRFGWGPSSALTYFLADAMLAPGSEGSTNWAGGFEGGLTAILVTWALFELAPLMPPGWGEWLLRWQRDKDKPPAPPANGNLMILPPAPTPTPKLPAEGE